MTEIPTSQQDGPTPAASSRTASERVAALTGRRGVLKVAGVVVGAGALAACSSPPVPAARSASSPAAAASAPGPSTPADPEAESEDVTPSSTSGAGGGTPTSEIPVGGGTVFPDTETVVTQPSPGTFKAFDAICPHAGCTVGSVESNQIICPCHQSHFDATTGDRLSGPAPTGLTPKTITVSGGSFTVP